MKQNINGFLCDTDTARLVATGRMGVSLYRTNRGYFFCVEEHAFTITFQSLTKGGAMDLYESMSDRKLDFEEAFDDED
jgi:hypothetical protein